jgi:hypothetical protein
MSDRKRELSSEDLAAFDLLIAYLEESNEKSINLRDFLFADGTQPAQQRADAAREANKRAADLKKRVADATAILETFEVVDPDEITLAQLNRDIPLAKLIEIRRSLGG